MGAQTFIAYGEGETAKAAFDSAVDSAQYDFGHAGYTGTIAEKHDFQMVDGPEGLDSMDHHQIEDWIEEQFEATFHSKDKELPFWDDKWGPAACIKVGETDYYFWGWASS